MYVASERLHMTSFFRAWNVLSRNEKTMMKYCVVCSYIESCTLQLKKKEDHVRPLPLLYITFWCSNHQFLSYIYTQHICRYSGLSSSFVFTCKY